MRRITIVLEDALYTELQQASAEIHEMGYTPEIWACEAVSATLASRRLPRVFVPRLTRGAQMRGTRGLSEPEDAAEARLVTHRVLIPSDTLGML